MPIIIPIRVRLELSGHVVVTIRDSEANAVRTLLDEMLAPGVHDLSWDGQNDDGEGVPRGHYEYQTLVNGDVRETRPLWIP